MQPAMRLRELLKVKHPIIQAPMAGTDTPKLVAAACNAGILGSLGAQYKTAEEITKAIAAIRSLTDKPFAVNLFALPALVVPEDQQIEEARRQLQKYYQRFSVSAPSAESVKHGIDPAAQLQAVLEARVPVFSFTLGMLNEDIVRAFKEQSTVLIGTATNVKEARALAGAGIDAIAAQGVEAGGHRGTFIGSFHGSMIGSMALIPQVVDAVRVPVIAAGGIMDGRGIAAALALGAQGVQMGTAFLTVAECAAHASYKAAIQQHDADQTTITSVFSGGPARGIENKFMLENSDTALLPFPFHNALTRPFRKIANETGAIDYTNLWCGQGGRLAKVVCVQELVDMLLSQTREALKDLSEESAW